MAIFAHTAFLALRAHAAQNQQVRCGLKAAIRCASHQPQLCGRSGLLHVRLLLAQHFFVSATASILRCSVFQQSRHREGQNQVHPDHPLPGRRSNNQVAKFAVITALDAKGRLGVPAELTLSEMVIGSFSRHRPAALYRSCRDYLKPNTPKH